MLWVFFSSALVSLSGADRESETLRGKRCSASGDLKIYPPNLLSMDWAFCLTAADLTQPYHSSAKVMMATLLPIKVMITLKMAMTGIMITAMKRTDSEKKGS